MTAPDSYPDLVEIDPFGGVSIWGQLNKGLGEKLLDGGTAGVRAAVNVSRHIGIEFGYNLMVNNVRLITPIRPGLPSYDFSNHIHYFALNPVYNFTPRGSRVRPYVTVGVGALHFVPTNQAQTSALAPLNQTLYGIRGLSDNLQVALNYGGGVKFHLSDHFGLRFDVRGLLSRNPTFGLPRSNDGGLYIIPKQKFDGLEATAGLVFYFGSKHVPPPPAPPPPPPAINAGDITGGEGTLCQAKAISVHSTASDPTGHALSYVWKLNGVAAAPSTSPDYSFTPNNAGDFKVEVAVSDSTDPSRTVTAGPKTITVQDDTPPQIASVAASPTTLSCAADTNGVHTASLSAQATGSACGGNLTYKWTVSEGSVTNDTSANATFDASTLSFESGGNQSKTVTATLTATDERGKSASQIASVTVNCPPQYKRLSDIVFAKNNARVNNCGKNILIEQAAPQAGTTYDVLLVAHRSADENENVAAGRHARGRSRAAAHTLDEQRALNAAAVLVGGHGTCANLDPSQIKMDLAGTDQTSTPDPGLCGTSNLPQTKERRGSQVSDSDKERRVEVYLIPKNSSTMPPAAKNARPVPEPELKALGCPR